MTTIVASRKAIAADSKITTGDTFYYGRKLYVFSNCILGVAGQGRGMGDFVRWVGGGAIEQNIPEPRSDEESAFEALLVNKDGIWRYGVDYLPEPVFDEFAAIGTGQQGARMALLLGCDLLKTIEMACEVDPYSGLDPRTKKPQYAELANLTRGARRAR